MKCRPCVLARGGWTVAFWICAAAVLYLALAAGERLPTTGWDKSNHVLAFATLGVLGALAWPGRLLQLSAGLVLYGALIEVLQSFTPHRHADWRDIAADALGILAACAVSAAARRQGLR